MIVRWPIRTQLLCLVLSVALPLIALLVYIKNEEAADDIRYASSSAFNIAQVTAASTEQFGIDSKALLQQLAQRARTQPINRAGCTSLLQNFTDLPSPYANLMVVDRSGQLVCSAR